MYLLKRHAFRTVLLHRKRKYYILQLIVLLTNKNSSIYWFTVKKTKNDNNNNKKKYTTWKYEYDECVKLYSSPRNEGTFAINTFYLQRLKRKKRKL